jgi:transposase
VIRLGELVMILDLHRQGLSVSAIARQLGRDRKTVRKYIERGLDLPAYGPRQPRPTVVTPFAVNGGAIFPSLGEVIFPRDL